MAIASLIIGILGLSTEFSGFIVFLSNTAQGASRNMDEWLALPRTLYPICIGVCAIGLVLGIIGIRLQKKKWRSVAPAVCGVVFCGISIASALLLMSAIGNAAHEVYMYGYGYYR